MIIKINPIKFWFMRINKPLINSNEILIYFIFLKKKIIWNNEINHLQVFVLHFRRIGIIPSQQWNS